MTHLDKDTLNSIFTEFMNLISERDLNIAFEVYGLNKPMLVFIDPRMSTDKMNWLRRKRNVVLTFEDSSLNISKKNDYNEASFSRKYGYTVRDYTLTAGAVPIVNDSGLMIGVLTVAGLMPQEDHDLALEVLDKVRGV